MKRFEKNWNKNNWNKNNWKELTRDHGSECNSVLFLKHRAVQRSFRSIFVRVSNPNMICEFCFRLTTPKYPHLEAHLNRWSKICRLVLNDLKWLHQHPFWKYFGYSYFCTVGKNASFFVIFGHIFGKGPILAQLKRT